MNILTAHRTIASTKEQLKVITRDYDKVMAATNTFIQWAKRKTQVRDKEEEPELDATLPPRRSRERKTMPGDLAEDETFPEAESAHRTGVHNQIIDAVKEYIYRLFLSDGTLYADLALLDPKNLIQVTSSGLP